jgi:two-component system response regulator HydG
MSKVYEGLNKLRFLQDFTVFRLGSNQPISIKTRVLAASNQNLNDLVKNGQFRLDLYHRLSGVHLRVPSLRERLVDIEDYARFFLDRFNAKYEKRIVDLEDNVFQVFKSYAWPGNIRELKYAIERAVVICEGERLSIRCLPDSIHSSLDGSQSAPGDKKSVLSALEDYRNDFARKLILDALRKANGNKVEAARALNISRQTLYNKIKTLGITNEFK